MKHANLASPMLSESREGCCCHRVIAECCGGKLSQAGEDAALAHAFCSWHAARIPPVSQWPAGSDIQFTLCCIFRNFPEAETQSAGTNNYVGPTRPSPHSQ